MANGDECGGELNLVRTKVVRSDIALTQRCNARHLLAFSAWPLRTSPSHFVGRRRQLADVVSPEDEAGLLG